MVASRKPSNSNGDTVGEEKNQEQSEKDRSKKDPHTDAEKAATNGEVAHEEESGGALPSNHSDES